MRHGELIYLQEKMEETKGLIRRVRTQAGVRHFGQPIGSIIVRDPVGSFDVGGRRQTISGALANNSPIDMGIVGTNAVGEPVEARMEVSPDDLPDGVSEVESDIPGARKYRVEGRRSSVYTWKVDGEWVLVNHRDEALAEGSSEREVVDAMRSLVKRRASTTTTTKKPTRTPRGGKTLSRRAATDEDIERIKAVHKVAPPPLYRDSVTVADVDDPENHEPLYQWTDKRGKTQPRYSPAYMERNAMAKFERVRELSKVIDKLDDYLEKNWQNDETAAALYLMRRTGIRPSSQNNETGDGATYGITTLQARHVTINQNSVRLNFTGKKQVQQDHTYRDKQIVEMFTQYKGDKQRRDEIFPTVTEHSLRAMMKEVTGEDFKVYDLRTLVATQYALQLVAERKRPAKPKNKTEFNKWRNVVGDSVSDMLGNNRTEALKSYIDPDVFSHWKEGIDGV